MLAANGTVYVDNTTLRAAARCSTELVLRHGLDYATSDEAPALECGIATHEILADHLKGQPADYCLAKYELLYRGYSEDVGLELQEHKLHRLSWTNTDKILREWLARHPLDSFSFVVNPKLVEVGFQLPLSDEFVCGCSPTQVRQDCWDHNENPAFVFCGRLDAIVQAQHDNGLYVLDHKTTGRIADYWTEKFRKDSQMTGYVWAAQKTLGQPIVGVFINGIEFSKLPSDPVRKCRTHGVPYLECGPMHMRSELLIYTRTPDQLEQWRQDAIRLAKRYRELCLTPDASLTSVPMEGTFHDACGFCNFSRFCDAGRPVHYIDAMLVNQPWRPFEIEEG